jgi:oligopeptide transport system ATP-binding protein
MSGNAILRVENLSVRYGIGSTAFAAVEDVSLEVARGTTFGLVGESGCGKSTIAAAILGLQPSSSGRVVFDGQELTALGGSGMRQIRRRIQMIFQDAAASLNPRLTVRGIIDEALTIHGLHRGASRRGRIMQLLEMTGIPFYLADRYPHELSGGQSQRVAISRALAVEPDLVICDEATSALDVSIQAQIVNLLQDLQSTLGLTYIFVSHDLGVVRHISDTVAVMYAGRIVEHGAKAQLYRRPLHPYTRALLSAVPVPDPRLERTRQRIVLDGEPPDPRHPSPGCRFATRCPLAVASCRVEEPALTKIAVDHWLRCPVTASATIHDTATAMEDPAITPTLSHSVLRRFS